MKEMKTDTILEDVIPDVVLWKESGLWMCFRNEGSFDKNEDPITSQSLYEPFNDFIKRTIKVFMDEEDNGIGLAEGMFKCVQIDYAIAEANGDGLFDLLNPAPSGDKSDEG